jgi:ketosteroid isomerase-like protein
MGITRSPTPRPHPSNSGSGLCGGDLAGSRSRSETAAMPFVALVAAAALAAAPAPAPAAASDQEQMRTIVQTLMSAVAPGDIAPWKTYLDDRFVYVTEGDQIQTKAQILKDFGPLPKGVTGSIRITRYRATVFGDFAVATHVDEEAEHIYGQDLAPRYLTTDTWRRTPQGWRLVMQHVKVILDEPPAQILPPSLLDEYAGTYQADGLSVRVQRDGDHLTAERVGGRPQAWRAEARDVFFVPGRPRGRQVFQRDASGRITGYADRREGHDIEMRRTS